MTIEQRVAPVKLYKPELASFNAGSIEFYFIPAQFRGTKNGSSNGKESAWQRREDCHFFQYVQINEGVLRRI